MLLGGEWAVLLANDGSLHAAVMMVINPVSPGGLLVP